MRYRDRHVASKEDSVHVDATARDAPVAFINLFNPTRGNLTTKLHIPLYYAGLSPSDLVEMRWGGSLAHPAAWPVPPVHVAQVLADFSARVHVAMAPRSFLWAPIALQAPATQRTASR